MKKSKSSNCIIDKTLWLLPCNQTKAKINFNQNFNHEYWMKYIANARVHLEKKFKKLYYQLNKKKRDESAFIKINILQTQEIQLRNYLRIVPKEELDEIKDVLKNHFKGELLKAGEEFIEQINNSGKNKHSKKKK